MGGLDTESQDPVYTHEALREALVEWVATRDQPFSKVDAPLLRKLIRLLNPDAEAAVCGHPQARHRQTQR